MNFRKIAAAAVSAALALALTACAQQEAPGAQALAPAAMNTYSR